MVSVLVYLHLAKNFIAILISGLTGKKEINVPDQ